MQRTLPKLPTLIVSAILALTTAGAGLYAYQAAHSPLQQTHNAQHQLTALSYPGQSGSDALTLLRRYAEVQVKHYSFGDQVIAINGVAGNGPKYWTFYINGKMADIGAGAYQTRASDTLSWKLQ